MRGGEGRGGKGRGGEGREGEGRGGEGRGGDGRGWKGSVLPFMRSLRLKAQHTIQGTLFVHI